jgi:hypothetical protein
MYSWSFKMQKREIFNPFQATAAVVEEKQTATASVSNINVGVCPKCGENMIRAVIANDDAVFYCEADRVSTPLPDEMCGAPI